MEKSKFNSIVKRIITALFLIPVTIGAIYYGFPYVQIMALIFGGMLAWEWSNMVPNQKVSFYSIVYTIVMGSAVLFSSWLGFVLILLGATFLVWKKSVGEPRRKLLILGVPYISIGIGSMIWLYDTVGFLITVWYLLMVWCVDIGGYVVGSNLKGPKLAPKVSPNKTWSGLIGGVLFSVIASIIFSYAVNSENHSYFYALLGGIIAVVAQMGDLFESAIKRSLGIKDSSNLIPGHGGVFDRIDGILFSAPLVVLFFKFGLCCFY